MHADDSADLLRRGREAIAAADWDGARAAFERASELEPSAEALDGLGQALHFQGEYGRVIELAERAIPAYLGRGKRAEAAQLARRLVFLHACVHGNFAVANGWMARAERMLEGVEECATHGWLTLDRAPFSNDSAERERLAGAAIAIARRFGDVDLEFEALSLLGDAFVASGRVEAGMKLLDEAMAAVQGGDVSGHGSVGMICCRLLGACEQTVDVRRAEQWMAVIDRLAAWSSFVSPTCRCHYGGILIAVGRWPDAEHELLAAIGAFETGYRAERLYPLVRLAELRVRQGRFEEAERLLEEREWHPSARRSLATIAFLRGELGLAGELARRCLDGADTPVCAPVLELLVGIGLATADSDAAHEALERLVELAERCVDERTHAFADLAAGRVLAAAHEPSAGARLQSAVVRFAALDLPYEMARAQLELARAVAASARDAAVAEARLALATFERLGALRDADGASSLLRELGARGRAWPRRGGELTAREGEVLSLLASGCSNAEIGERLFISRRTAEHHVASILAKLGARTRAEAAAYALREQPARSVVE